MSNQMRITATVCTPEHTEGPWIIEEEFETIRTLVAGNSSPAEQLEAIKQELELQFSDPASRITYVVNRDTEQVLYAEHIEEEVPVFETL